MSVEPVEIPIKNTFLTVTMSRCKLQKNWASISLLYISKGSTVNILESKFEENFSIGRGSIIFSENSNALALISNSNFTSNYAIYGGIFFTQLNGLVDCNSCTMKKNFAVYGGVLYSQNEG